MPGDEYTHISQDGPKGKFYVSSTDRRKFMCDYIEDVVINNKSACVSEHITSDDPRPVIADIDWVCPIEKLPDLERKGRTHVYGNAVIKRVVRAYQDAIKEVIDNPSSVNLVCVVLEKPSYRVEEDRIKDGFHVHFPYCVTDTWVQKEPLYSSALKHIEADGVFRENRHRKLLTPEAVSDIKKIVDNLAMINTNLMYGSSKKHDKDAYRCTMCFNEDGEQISTQELIARNPKFQMQMLVESDSETDDSDSEDEESDFSDYSDGEPTSSAPERERPTEILTATSNELAYSGPAEHMLPIVLSIVGKCANAMPRERITQKFRSVSERATKLNKMKSRLVEAGAAESDSESDSEDKPKVIQPGALQFGEYIQVSGKEPVRMPNPDMAPSSELKQACEIIPILRWERASTYDTWIKVGVVLYSIGKAHRYGLDLWIAFSTLDLEKFDRDACIRKWNSFEVRDYHTIRTLFAWARQDNPNALRKMRRNSLPAVVDELIQSGGSHFYCARLLAHMYKDRFVCASIKHKIWYEYKNHRWFAIEQGHSLQMHIAEHLSLALLDADSAMHARTEAQLQSIYDNGGEDSHQAQHLAIAAGRRNQELSKIQRKLGDDGYQRRVMNQAAMIFYHNDFVSKLDQNPNYLGYENGVLDLETLTFAPGTPDHFVSMSTKCDFNPDYTWDHPDVKLLMDIYGKIFHDKDVNKAWWRLVASCMYGGNPDKIVPFLTGVGNNAKSTVIDHLDMVFGEYFCTIPVEFITGKNKDSGAARPELWRTQGKRILAVLETGDSAKVNEGLFRRVSGNDKMYARTLYAEGGDIKPMFTIFIVANRLPVIKSGLAATWDRVFVMPHYSKFIKNAPTDIESQRKLCHFPVDPSIQDKFRRTKSAMHWIMFEFWKEYKELGLHRPTVIKKCIEMYRGRNDRYGQFIKEYLVDDPDGTLGITELYDTFKDWHADEWNGERMPNRTDFRDYLVKAWGRPSTGRKWKGRRWRLPDDEAAQEESQEDARINMIMRGL